MSAGQVHVLPSGIDLELGADETLLAAAQRSGYRWPTVCGGRGTCRTCYVVVESGSDHCTPVAAWEAEGLATIGPTVSGEVRLACQLHVQGGRTVVSKRGVKRATPSASPVATVTEESA